MTRSGARHLFILILFLPALACRNSGLSDPASDLGSTDPDMGAVVCETVWQQIAHCPCGNNSHSPDPWTDAQGCMHIDCETHCICKSDSDPDCSLTCKGAIAPPNCQSCNCGSCSLPGSVCYGAGGDHRVVCDDDHVWRPSPTEAQTCDADGGI